MKKNIYGLKFIMKMMIVSGMKMRMFFLIIFFTVFIIILLKY